MKLTSYRRVHVRRGGRNLGHEHPTFSRCKGTKQDHASRKRSLTTSLTTAKEQNLDASHNQRHVGVGYLTDAGRTGIGYPMNDCRHWRRACSADYRLTWYYTRLDPAVMLICSACIDIRACRPVPSCNGILHERSESSCLPYFGTSASVRGP